MYFVFVKQNILFQMKNNRSKQVLVCWARVGYCYASCLFSVVLFHHQFLILGVCCYTPWSVMFH